eukprot:c23547_g2_i1 orf=502-846(+)
MRMQASVTRSPAAQPASAKLRRQDLEPRLDIRGRHRTQAELNRLNQEITVLEEELQRLENMEYASVGCREMVLQIANAPDPLIMSRARGTSSPGQSLNRWFEQPAQTNNCCWMF